MGSAVLVMLYAVPPLQTWGAPLSSAGKAVQRPRPGERAQRDHEITRERSRAIRGASHRGAPRSGKEKPRRTEQRADLTLVLCEVRPAQTRLERCPVACHRPRDGDTDRLVRAKASAAAGPLRRELRSAPTDVDARAREVRERRVRRASILPAEDNAAWSETVDRPAACDRGAAAGRRRRPAGVLRRLCAQKDHRVEVQHLSRCLPDARRPGRRVPERDEGVPVSLESRRLRARRGGRPHCQRADNDDEHAGGGEQAPSISPVLHDPCIGGRLVLRPGRRALLLGTFGQARTGCSVSRPTGAML